MIGPVPVPQRNLPDVVIGTIAGVSAEGAPQVDFPGNPAGQPLPALTTATVAAGDAGSTAALLFIDGNPLRPLVLGIIRHEMSPVAMDTGALGRPQVEARLDGQRVVLTADTEIELKCGKASITLTRAGKVLIRGIYLLSRSSGANRIQGGSVEIN